MKSVGKLIKIPETVCLLIVVCWLNIGKGLTGKSMICKFYGNIVFSKKANIHVEGRDLCDLDVETDACELKSDVE